MKNGKEITLGEKKICDYMLATPIIGNPEKATCLPEEILTSLASSQKQS